MPYNIRMDKKKIEETIEHMKQEVVRDARDLRQPAGRNRRRFWGIAAALGLLIAGAAGVASYYLPNYFLSETEAYVHVREQMTATDIADQLYDDGLIINPGWFRLVARVTGQADELKQGEYTIRSDMSLQQILAKLKSGKSEAARLVVPEGYTVRQTAQALDKLGIVKEEDFLRAANDTSLLYPYMKGNRKVTFVTEGFLFPDTYLIGKDATAEDVVTMMLKNFDRHLTDGIRQQIGERNMSIYQFVTLASLIEKEAKYAEDRPLIASVFLNRLSRHMKLQSDASISYAMGTHKAAYSISETEYDSPYNTYRYEGLPPGPIANPGMDCMKAIIDAPNTSYLYFVADKDGHNYFATTYENHMKNVKEYMP